MAYKLSIKRDDCIGCGTCSDFDNWEMDEEDKAKPIDEVVEEIDDNQDAADTCPVNAIVITEIKD